MKTLIIIVFLFCSAVCWGEDTFDEYYQYAEQYFLLQSNGSYFGQDKNDFCIKLATQLYSQKANLNRLKKRLKEKDPFERFMSIVPYKQEYREWAFVNRKGLLTGKFIGQGSSGRGGYTLDEIDYKREYQMIYESWFKPYITLEKLEKKWKGKPAPRGYDEFIQKYKIVYI